MKKIQMLIVLAISFFLMLNECTVNDNANIPKCDTTSLKIKNDSLLLVIDSLQVKDTLLSHKYDSVRTSLYNSNFKIERVKYYLNICLKNPTQDKFLKGWIKRTVIE
jgi:hypothetical protein